VVVVGKTETGVEIVEGVYRYFETHGIPLDILFSVLRDRNRMPSWLQFYDEARAGGMKHDRILSKLDPAITDVYGSDFKKVVLEKLDQLRRK
jgi:hypothetical protein